jgi:sensor histidine kinase YesM
MAEIKTMMNIFKLSKYSLKAILLRLMMATLAAIVYVQLLLIVLSLLNRPSGSTITETLIMILGFNLLTEINVALDSVYERIFPLPHKLSQRLFVHFFVGIGLLISLFFGLTALLPYTLQSEKEIFYFNLIIGLILMNSISSRLILIRFTEKLFQSQAQLASLKQEKLKMDYKALQDTVNPHFLFNNLTVLKSYIYSNNECADSFIENFTDVYRYVLESSEKQLVHFNEELEFIKAYIDLHLARLSNGLSVNLNVEPCILERRIAPMTLQLLVENAIKHNVASKEQVLEIKIFNEGNHIVVDNPIRKKKDTYSTQIGLKNLVQRYRFLTDKDIFISKENKHFTVKVPLL